MGVVKVNKTKDFTVMSNYHFKEKNMSLKAKGLLSLMLSLPENWDYSIAGLIQLSSDGDTSVRNALKELEKFHYLERKRVYKDGKIVDWEYNIYEVPAEKAEKLLVEKQQVENQVVENNDNKILNNKILNNGNSSNKITVKKPLVKKRSLYEKASVLIYEFTDNPELQNALFTFLNLQLEIYKTAGKQYYINIWKNRLSKLASGFKKSEWLEVVRYSTERGWQNFYPLPTANHGNAWNNDGVSCERATAEELEYNRKSALEREKNGRRGFF